MNLPLEIQRIARSNMKCGPERSPLESKFLNLWQRANGPILRSEYLFHVPIEGDRQRLWRFDFAHPISRVAVELDGGAFTQGRHTRGKGFEQDCEKLNTAAEQGWRVFRFTVDMLDEAWVGRIVRMCDAISRSQQKRIDVLSGSGLAREALSSARLTSQTQCNPADALVSMLEATGAVVVDEPTPIQQINVGIAAAKRKGRAR